MSERRDAESAALLATIGAAVIIAHQVAAKATRQDLFLSSFPADKLSILIIGAALFSIVPVVFVSRAMAASGPGKLVPAAFGASAILHLLEWALSFHFPKLVAVAFYLHFAGLGAVLISGFWSLVNERFDPHTARKKIVQIAGGAASGALAGGGIAFVIGHLKNAPAMLPALCAMHLACAWVTRTLGLRAASSHPAEAAAAVGGLRAGARLLGKHRYLRDLAFLVFIGAGGAILLELVFMAQAEAAIGREKRLPFFALFYTAANIINCAVQAYVTRSLLEKSGLGVAAGARPATIALGSLGAALSPGIGSAVLARGSEQVVLNSLFRSAYELFYTPLPPAEKRCAKPLIDVGFERLGDMAGGAFGKCLFYLSPGTAQTLMLGAAAGSGLAGMWAARRLDRGYVVALERSLKDRAVELNLEDIADHTTRITVLRTMAVLPASGRQSDGEPPAIPSAPPDPLRRRIADLRSGDPERVRRALENGPVGPELAAHAVALLGWDEAAEHAAQALRGAGPSVTGQLLDALLDQRVDFTIRRRIPRVLAAFPSARARNGLISGLNDKRFEVRYRCGRALAAMLGQESELAISRDDIYRAVQKELKADKGLWQSHRLLDGTEEDQLVGDRANRGLEHVFTLLSLVLPRKPLQISFYALHTDDIMLRGTALEYLDNVLPPSIRERLHALLGDTGAKDHAPRGSAEALAALLESHESVQARLLALRARNDAAAGIR